MYNIEDSEAYNDLWRKPIFITPECIIEGRIFKGTIYSKLWQFMPDYFQHLILFDEIILDYEVFRKLRNTPMDINNIQDQRLLLVSNIDEFLKNNKNYYSNLKHIQFTLSEEAILKLKKKQIKIDFCILQDKIRKEWALKQEMVLLELNGLASFTKEYQSFLLKELDFSNKLQSEKEISEKLNNILPILGIQLVNLSETVSHFGNNLKDFYEFVWECIKYGADFTSKNISNNWFDIN